MLLITYILWAAAVLLFYRSFPRPGAIWIVLVAGLLILPPARYAAPGDASVFPYWIIGGALPSDILVTKAWVAPSAALLASMVFERERWQGVRLGLADAPILLFCTWPTLRLAIEGTTNPSGALSSLYLFGVWGVPWLLGRLHLRSSEDFRAFASVLAAATAMTLPFALVEGVSSFRFQSLLGGAHPYAFDGIDRYVGYRPQLLFENGNQYGIWCAGAALAAVWRGQQARAEGGAIRWWSCIAAALVFQTLASQSVGAILLMLAGLPLLAVRRAWRTPVWAVALAVGIAAAVGTLHVSGIVPLRSLAKETAIGRAALAALRETGRQSLAWRVSQDLKTIALVKRNVIAGAPDWDWFRPAGTRPWGLPFLILGQFGIVGLGALVAAYLTALSRLLAATRRGYDAARLGIVLLLVCSLDALLNSFLFYPAVAMAGASLAQHPSKHPA